jgi:hypothetical protein
MNLCLLFLCVRVRFQTLVGGSYTYRDIPVGGTTVTTVGAIMVFDLDPVTKTFTSEPTQLIISPTTQTTTYFGFDVDVG